MAKMYQFVVTGHGRQQRSFGTDDPQTQAAIKTMIAELKKRGHAKVLEGIVAKRLTLMQAYMHWSEGNINTLTVEGALPFYATATDWLAGYDDIKRKTKINYRSTYDQLIKVRASFPVQDIPSVLIHYRKLCYQRREPVAFNTARNALRSFLGNYFSLHHHTYLAVAQIKSLPTNAPQPLGLSVVEVRDLMTRLRPDVAAQFWTMCITGAGLTEYAAGLTVEGNGIRVRGEKMSRIDSRRNRLVPMIEPPALFALHQKQLRTHLHEASGKQVKISDARKTFAGWCTDAGIEYHRVMQYMGHRMLTTTDRYKQSKLHNYLADDAALLKAYLYAPPKVEALPAGWIPL